MGAAAKPGKPKDETKLEFPEGKGSERKSLPWWGRVGGMDISWNYTKVKIYTKLDTN